jgi:hypothetical protein
MFKTHDMVRAITPQENTSRKLTITDCPPDEVKMKTVSSALLAVKKY